MYSGNIIEDTLQVNYFDTQNRLDPVVTVPGAKNVAAQVSDKGLFPQIREFSVRRAGVSENAPVIQVDLSASAPTADMQRIRQSWSVNKRYITHAVNFKTVPSQTGASWQHYQARH